METATNPRLTRGLAIVRKGGVRKLRRSLWSVNSQSHAGHYLVDLAADEPACTCPDFEERGNLPNFRCKPSPLTKNDPRVLGKSDPPASAPSRDV